ncbi:MAG TPA: hypothetical protein PKE16_04030 [Hyphomicrobium sp.]|nr:hypothetical protein [Hyphomicrobium sp.]
MSESFARAAKTTGLTGGGAGGVATGVASAGFGCCAVWAAGGLAEGAAVAASGLLSVEGAGDVAGASDAGLSFAGGVTIAVSVGAATGAASGFESVDLASSGFASSGLESLVTGVDGDAGVSLAAGVAAAVEAGLSADVLGFGGAAEAAGGTSLGGSEGLGIAAVVVGDEGVMAAVPVDASCFGGKYVVVPLDASCAAVSAIAAGTDPAQQAPNKLTPRRRSVNFLIIPRLAPMGERRSMPILPTLREPSSWRKNA